MSAPNLNDLNPGDRLPDFTVPAITRQTLAVYCGASGDHNPIHVDIDFAKASGLDDVIAHGMLVMGYCSRALLELAPQEALIEFDTRFVAMTHVGDEICVSIEVVGLNNRDEGRVLTLGLEARNQHGEVKTTGTAAVLLAAKNA